MKFGKNVKRMRLKKNWSQEDLAERSGIGQQYISQLENGQREPGLRTIEALAGSFRISIVKLMRGL